MSRLVAAYRLSDQVSADETFPAREYGLLFEGASGAETITLHVRDGGSFASTTTWGPWRTSWIGKSER